MILFKLIKEDSVREKTKRRVTDSDCSFRLAEELHETKLMANALFGTLNALLGTLNNYLRRNSGQIRLITMWSSNYVSRNLIWPMRLAIALSALIERMDMFALGTPQAGEVRFVH